MSHPHYTHLNLIFFIATMSWLFTVQWELCASGRKWRMNWHWFTTIHSSALSLTSTSSPFSPSLDGGRRERKDSHEPSLARSREKTPGDWDGNTRGWDEKNWLERETMWNRRRNPTQGYLRGPCSRVTRCNLVSHSLTNCSRLFYRLAEILTQHVSFPFLKKQM